MSDLSQVSGALRDVQRSLNQLAQQNQFIVENTAVIGRQQEVMRSDLDQMRQDFAEFVRADAMAKQLQLAETRLVSVRQELETEFGHYGEVRRLSTGTLQALDAGIVTHTSIQSLTEEVMLTTPRYWLAPALVALGAWIRDDSDLAAKALSEALERDVDKVALFFTLITRRYQRSTASARWLDLFLTRQDPANLDREFIVILDAVACGAFGAQAKGVVSAHIGRWVEDLEQVSGFTNEQVDRWTGALRAFTPAAPGGFDHLRTYAKADWPRLEAALAQSGLHGMVLKHFHDVFDGPLSPPTTLAVQVDDILTRLVSDFDVEELPLRRDEARLQLIISENGDVTRADAQYDAMKEALQEKSQLLTVITNAALFPERSGASRATQRLATAMSKDWLVAAYDQLTVQSRAARPSTVDLELDGFKCTIGGSIVEDDVVRQANQWVAARRDAALLMVKLTPLHYVAMVAAVGFVVLGFMSPFWLLFAAAAGAYAFFGWKGLDKRRAVVEQEAADRRAAIEVVVRASNAELVDLVSLWDKQDAVGEEARAVLVGITPEQFSLRPSDGGREVLS